MKFRTCLSLGLIIFFAAACRLQPIEEAALITEAPSITLAPSNTPAPIFTSQPSATVQPTQQSVATAIAPNCAPTHPEWPSYTVQVGDTLGSIANRAGTNTDTLVSVNCIANANMISVGMLLRVPSLPITPTASPIVRPAEQCLLTENGAGMPVISPSSVRSATCVGLQAGMVTVTWPEAPANAAMVEFWRMNANGITDVIGVDDNLADGAAIQWQVDASMPASVIYAVPYVTGGSEWSGQLSVYIGQ